MNTIYIGSFRNKYVEYPTEYLLSIDRVIQHNNLKIIVLRDKENRVNITIPKGTNVVESKTNVDFLDLSIIKYEID